MEVVKRGYGLFSVAMTQVEADTVENACVRDGVKSENVIEILVEKYVKTLLVCSPGVPNDGS